MESNRRPVKSLSQYYSEEEDDSELNTTRSNADSCYYEDEGNEYKDYKSRVRKKEPSPERIQPPRRSSISSNRSLLTDSAEDNVNIEMVLAEMQEALTDMDERPSTIKRRQGVELNWNEQFQRALELPQKTPQERLTRYETISNIAKNFEETAKTFGKIIIAEAYVPNEFKTIEPLPETEVGGQAGGLKYIYNGIFFKFATDWKNIYGGDEYSMKAASHELKGLSRFIACEVEGLSVPLLALVNYMGFRLIATSILPIGRDTLVYGSMDAGNTVCNDNLRLSGMMDTIGKKLNLKRHAVGNPGKHVWTSIDTEGHLGRDGRFYIIDCARTFPPTTPQKGVKSCYLYKLLRPELTRSNVVPLSPDAFSPFDRFDADRIVHRREITEATNRLLTVVIPKFAEWLDKSLLESNTNDAKYLFSNSNAKRSDKNIFIDHLHRAGINVRYIGVLRKHVRNPSLKKYLLLEMVSRVTKNVIREKLREAMRNNKTYSLGTENFKLLILNLFNLIIGRGEAQDIGKKSEEFWERELSPRLEKHFIHFPTRAELLEEISLENSNMDLQVMTTIASSICTYTVTSQQYFKQDYYTCYTCSMRDSWGCCLVCAKICHKGHTLSERKHGEFFCDCGQAGFCKAIGTKTITNVNIKDTDSALKHVVMTTVGIHLLFKRIDRFNDVTLSKRCKKEMEENPTSFVFVYPDIEDFETTAKHMSFTSLAEAHALHLRSRLSETGRERMFHVSQTKFEEAIAANPDSTETILLYANVLKEQALKHSFKIDWKMLESVVLKYSEANNASEIYSLVESLKEENAYKPYYIEFRCQAMSAIYTIQGGIEDIITNHCQGKLDLTGTYGFTQFVIESVASCSKLLSILNLNDLDPILNDKEIIQIVSHCPNLTEFSISDSDATDQTLFSLATNCPKLQKLDLSWCKLIHGDGFRELTKGCPNLVHINLQGCTNIVNSSVAMLVLGRAQLTYLNLSGWIPLQDSALEALGKFSRQLKNLYLSSVRFSTPALLGLTSQLTHLELLELVGASKGVSDSVISSIATNCKYIHSLSLARCTNYSSSCLENLMKHLRLKSLDISGNKQLTGASLCTISEYCTNIEFLDLSGCVNITDESIAKLGLFAGTNLQSISLGECMVTDIGVEALLSSCPNITRLNLADTGITDATLAQIPLLCPKIFSLDLSRCWEISYTALSKLVGSMKKLLRLSITSCKKISKHNRQALQNMYPALFKSITSRASALADISLQRDSKLSLVSTEDEDEEPPGSVYNSDTEDTDVDKP